MIAHAPIEHATALATPASFDRLVGVVSRKTRHRGGENTEDCSYPSRATIEGARIEETSIEHATIAHATIEHTMIGHATLEQATLEHATLEHATTDRAAGDGTFENTIGETTCEYAPAPRERGGHHLLMTSDPSTSAPRLRPDPFDSSQKDPWRSWRHGALAVIPSGVLLPTSTLAVNPDRSDVAVNPDSTHVAVAHTGALAAAPAVAVRP